MPLIDTLWWNRAHAVPNNNRDAAVANTLAADSANSNNAMNTNFDVSSLMSASAAAAVAGGGGVGPAQSSGAGVASGAARWSTFTPGEIIHIDWSRYNNASAIRDFVETPDGSSSGNGLLQSTFRVMGNIGDAEEADAGMGTDPNSAKIAASFTELFQQQQNQPSSFLAPHGELIHIDWARNNNASAIRDFKNSEFTRDQRGVLRSTFAVLGDAQQSAAAAATTTDMNYDDFGGGALSSHLRSAGLGGSSYLSSVKGDAGNLCGGRLEGFERCLSLNGGDADRCADAWEKFVTCQQEMQARSSFY